MVRESGKSEWGTWGHRRVKTVTNRHTNKHTMHTDTHKHTGAKVYGAKRAAVPSTIKLRRKTCAFALLSQFLLFHSQPAQDQEMLTGNYRFKE